jgi:hypothetical protein
MMNDYYFIILVYEVVGVESVGERGREEGSDVRYR